MKVYLAGQGGFPWKNQNYYNFYRLDSYFDIKSKSSYHYKFKDYILDSGVFTYLTSKKDKKVDWDKYVYEYANYVKKEGIINYVEVDVDVKIGLKEVERLRQNLEKSVGYNGIPVWHLNRGYDKWLEICKDYDYICFGAFLTDGLKESKFNFVKKFLFDAKKNNSKVHGLGMT